MKIRSLLILSLIINSYISFGQTSNNELIDSLYFKALSSRIDLMISSGIKYFEINENTVRISNLFNNSNIEFIDNERIINKSIKERKSLNLNRIVHKWISSDTIDFNFGYISVIGKRKIHFSNGLKFKKGFFSLACGGTSAYSPDIRFVYDKNLNNWMLTESKFLNLSNSKVIDSSKYVKCIRKELIECIENYISETINENFFITMYPTVYFFEINNKKYFSIWIFNSIPKYVEAMNKEKTFLFSTQNIKNRDVFLIRDLNNKKSELYNCSEESLDIIVKSIRQDEIESIYDGTWFPKTYVYFVSENNEIQIKPNGELIIDILGKDFLEFENLLKKQSNFKSN